MKATPKPPAGTPVTLQSVLDRLATAVDLNPTRCRDLRSAVSTYASLVGREPAAIPLDLGALRDNLDRMVPAQAQVSAKRWANLRSDLAAALEASGLATILKTAGLPVAPAWQRLLAGKPQSVWAGLSRFVRWASLREVTPEGVDTATVARFIAELELTTLVRKLRDLHRAVAKSWNSLVRLSPGRGLSVVEVPSFKLDASRVAWDKLPGSFRADLERYLEWCGVPDPLDENARARALATGTRDLRRDQIHSAVTAALAAGVPADRLMSLAALVDVEVVRALLRRLWKEAGGKLTAYTHGVAGTLLALAKEWVRCPADQLEQLKGLRRKLGSLPVGLTEKNEGMLRRFDDPRLLRDLVRLPDKMWREARKMPAGSARAFLLFQNALAIDLLLQAPMRMESLSPLSYETDLHWPQGPGKPALLVLSGADTKNGEKLDLELATQLADRLLTFRNSIAPPVIGSKPSSVFVTFTGARRGQSGLSRNITVTIRRRLGIKVTPHQFRHLAAKIYLDRNPGGFEVIRQLLGHKNTKTTINAYAGINTRRAGRAHADLLMQIREREIAPRPRRRKDV